jgi:uncharacterized protein YceK
MFKLLPIVVLALPTALCGCGTMSNMHDATGNSPPKVFGGLATDLNAIGEGDLLGLVDIPGSLVGDVVTLPDVVLTNARHQRMTARLEHEMHGDGTGSSKQDDVAAP